MEQPAWAGVRTMALAATALFFLPLLAQGERNWEFSVGAFMGKAFNSNGDVKVNFSEGSGLTPGTAH